MEYPNQEIEFLDLADADEEQRNFIRATLFTRNPNLKYPELPWIAPTDLLCSPAEWRPPYVPGEPADGPVVVATLDGDDCSSATTQNAASPAEQEVMSQEPHSVAGTGVHTTSSVYADTSVISVPPQIPTTVPAQPSVMTTMYHIPGVPLSNVYVGNVTANVNVHGFMSGPYGAYQHISPQQVYPGEVSHESGPPVRNGRDTRRGRSKPGNKRIDGHGQYGDRSSGRHTQEVMSTQAPPLVDSPPTVNSNIPQQNFPLFPISPMHHHPYSPQFYNAATPSHPAHHMAPHPSAQHAAGTPIYLSGHPAAMYAHPPIYSTYPHQPGGTPIMPFPTAMQSGPVPTTENSVLGSYQVEGTEERVQAPTPGIVGNKEAELEQVVQQTQPSPQPVVYSHEPIQELCETTNEVMVSGQNSAKPASYQQQQSEEDDFSQTNIVNTVVVNNSSIVTEPLPFGDTKQSGVGDAENSHIAPSSGPQSFRNDVLPPSFVPDNKSSNPEAVADSNVSLNLASRANVGDTSASVSDSDSKKEKRNVPSPMTQQEKTPIDVKTSLPQVDVPTSVVPSKLTLGSSADSVAPFTNNPQTVSNSVGIQHQTSGQNVEVASPQLGKSWASLFRKNSGPNSPGDAGLMTGTHVTGVSGGSKPLACVKPLQNAIPDPSRRVTEGSATQSFPSGASPVSGAIVSGKPFLHMQPPTSAEDPYLCRLGEFLFKYQLEHKTLSLQPRGLTNRSNWCYINSTLQALLACPPFYNLMKALQTPLSARRTGKSATPIIDSMVQFVAEFVPLSSATRPRDRKEKAVRKEDGSIEDQCGAPFEPNYIYKMLNCIRSDTFKVEGRQEDAEEFLGCLLNALNDEMLELIKLVEEPATKSTLSNGDIATNGDTSAQSQDEDEAEWKVMGPKNKGSITRRADFGRTPISDIFRGQLRSRVQRAGDQSTDNVQPFFTLQLDIEKAQSVKDALEILVGRDQLEGVTCSRTNQEVEAWQQVTLEELPLVLLLHLKWFDYKLDGASKIIKCVEFPIDLKVDLKLMSSTKKYGPKQRQYKLFAVVYHDGKEATKGHYVTDVYHMGYGGWVRYDDSVVKAVQETTVLHPKVPRVPYLLYYRRCDTIGSTQPASVPDKTR